MKVKVVKRDGSIEDFDEAKISKVVTAAGLPADKAQNLATSVSEWAKASGQEQVTTLQVKNKVIEELKKVDEYVANLFTWYEKTKEEEQSSDSKSRV